MEDKDNIYKFLVFGLVPSIVFFYIVQPLFSFLGNTLFTFVSQLITAFNNNVYQRIALRDYSLDKHIYIFFIYIFFLIYLLLFFYFHRTYNGYLHEMKKLEERVHNLGLIIEGEDKIIDIQEEKERMKKQLLLSKTEIKRTVIKTGLISGVSILSFLLIVLLNYSTELTIKNKISIYENTKRIILPYISDLDDKTFESKFVLIKNEEDYDNLLNEMNDTVIKNGLMVIWVKNKR